MKFQLRIIACFVFAIFASFQVSAAPDSNKADSERLLHWMRAHVAPSTGMPLSFEILGNSKMDYRKIGRRSSITGIIERMIVEEGISVYDAALWQIAMTETGNEIDRENALRLIDYYWKGSIGEFDQIRTGSGRQIFVYDPDHPQEVTSEHGQEGRRGFIFRIINAHGKYLAKDPLDGKEAYAGFPNNPMIHWEDWKPIAGENAWVVMAALHLFMSDSKRVAGDSAEFKLARELARAAMILQADNGGVRMAPIGTYYHLQDIDPNLSDEEIAHELDIRAKTVQTSESDRQPEKIRVGRLEYPPYHLWYYDEISVENNISWFAAFRMLYRLTGEQQYLDAMKRVEECVMSFWDPEKRTFYQGGHFTDGKWVPNKDPFAVDVQNWAIIVFGPEKIDSYFGDGASLEIWKAVKKFSGVYSPSGVLQGVGFTTENNRLSIEWTAGAILAARMMARYYRDKNSALANEASLDATSMRAGIEQYRFTVRPGQDAYAYSSLRRWIPFGWFSHESEVLSLASTAWVYLIDRGINPFEL